MSERAVYFHPVPGIEALPARFVEHAYMPHSHPTWTVAVVHHGVAQSRSRCTRGEMFSTGHDAANRTAVRAVPTAELDIVGIALRSPHRDADAVLRGLSRHP